MKLEYLKRKKELIPITLLGVSMLMAVAILYLLTDFSAVSARAENVVNDAIKQNNNEEQDVEQYFKKDREIANSLIRNNIITDPETLDHPVN